MCDKEFSTVSDLARNNFDVDKYLDSVGTENEAFSQA